jgi:glutathione S-transferase
MLTLFYSPGACSMAAHVILEEAGAPYEAKRVDFSKSEQRSDAYLKINPFGRVPALVLDDGTPITENTAILPYLGKRLGFWPSDPVAEAKALSVIGFFAASVHLAHAHARRTERYAADPAAFPTIQETGRKTFRTHLQQIDRMLEGREWLSDRYSVLDPYALVFYAWGLSFHQLPMRTEFKHYTALRDRLMERPAVRRVVEQEGVEV